MKKIVCLSLVIGILLLSNFSFAQVTMNYPTKPINYIIPFGAGGGADITSRTLCKIAERILGQTIIPENKSGGAGAIGINHVAKAKPDGYTIGSFTFSSTIIGPHIRDIPFKTKEDFSFIAQVAAYTHAFVVKPDSSWKTVKEFIDDARENPGKRTYGTPGAKGVNHINWLMLSQQANVKLKHIPYAGDKEELAAIMGGHVDAAMIAAVLPQIRSGSIRALAVDSPERWKDLPEVPTLRELGYEVIELTFIGVVGPKGIPKEILQTLEKAFERAAKDQLFIETMERIYMLPTYLSGVEFKNFIFREYDRVGDTMRTFKFD